MSEDSVLLSTQVDIKKTPQPASDKVTMTDASLLMVDRTVVSRSAGTLWKPVEVQMIYICEARPAARRFVGPLLGNSCSNT